MSKLPDLYDHDDDEYYVVPVIPVDYLIHNQSGFCDDLSCPCHENQKSIDELNDEVLAGNATPDDADRIYRGKTV